MNQSAQKLDFFEMTKQKLDPLKPILAEWSPEMIRETIVVIMAPVEKSMTEDYQRAMTINHLMSDAFCFLRDQKILEPTPRAMLDMLKQPAFFALAEPTSPLPDELREDFRKFLVSIGWEEGSERQTHDTLEKYGMARAIIGIGLAVFPDIFKD